MFKFLHKLYTPTKLYIFLSIFSFIILLGQNIMYGKPGSYCNTLTTCNSTSIFDIFFPNLLYLFIWSSIINFLYYKDYTKIAWGIVITGIFLIIYGSFLVLTNKTDDTTSPSYNENR